nr:MAG TPA: hypothetical protein [Caudoviricetes sp.]
MFEVITAVVSENFISYVKYNLASVWVTIIALSTYFIIWGICHG